MDGMSEKELVTENSGILTNTFVCVCTFLKLNKTNSGKNDDKKGNKGSTKNDSATESGKTAVVFSLKNEVGGLVRALKLFQVNAKMSLSNLKTVCVLVHKPVICYEISLNPFLDNVLKGSKRPHFMTLCKRSWSVKQ